MNEEILKAIEQLFDQKLAPIHEKLTPIHEKLTEMNQKLELLVDSQPEDIGCRAS